MNLEFMNFYPIEVRKVIRGTLHLKVIFQCTVIELRGILCYRDENEQWTFKMPKNSVLCSERKIYVTYYVFTFNELAQNKALLALINEKAPPFIEEKLKAYDLASGSKNKFESTSTQGVSKSSSQEPLRIVSEQTRTPKIWTDPPKRSAIKRSALKFKQKADSR